MLNKLFGLLAIVLVLQGCVHSYRRPLSADERDLMEIRVENQKWSTAKVFIIDISTPQGRQIAVVPYNIQKTVRERISSTFRLQVIFVGGDGIWDGAPWSPNERCLELTVMHQLGLTNIYPCMR